MSSQFKNWKCRCSSLGHILTNRETISEKQLDNIKILEDERDTGVNINGNKVKWTPSKEEKLTDLIAKRDKKPELPAGVKTHLDNVFRVIFWGRKRLLYNKFLDKGNICESDGLQLLSDVEDDVFYEKNNEHLENEFIQGTPDNRQFGFIKDIKTSWDLESFDNAELTKLYEWQVEGYLWLDKKSEGELIYCLVNAPYHQLMNEKTTLFYKMGGPGDDEERFIKAKQQLERNMIFDIKKWQEDYPNYDFENNILDWDIPDNIRVKRFDVELFPEDIKFIKERVKMCREYLVKKEEETLDKLKKVINKK